MNIIRQKVYALFFWRLRIGEVLTSFYDICIFLKKSFKCKNTDKNNIEAYLQKQFHVIEKGLALPNPRPGFGKEKIRDVISQSEQYIAQYGKSLMTESVINCLDEYLMFNTQKNEDLSGSFYQEIVSFLNKYKPADLKKTGGTKEASKNDILNSVNINFERFIQSRHSVRDFASTTVSAQTIHKAIELAKFAPSACNRQGWFVHVYHNPNKVQELLLLQRGNRGFTEAVDKLLIVTGDLKAFTRYESNQVFVDGGLFSMNVILSLHSLGVGSIPLSTAVPYVIEKQIIKAAEIPNSERLIMMIAIGNLKEKFKVAVSQRKSTEEILITHN